MASYKGAGMWKHTLGHVSDVLIKGSRNPFSFAMFLYRFQITGLLNIISVTKMYYRLSSYAFTPCRDKLLAGIMHVFGGTRKCSG
jgi:hypothetical protein